MKRYRGWYRSKVDVHGRLGSAVVHQVEAHRKTTYFRVGGSGKIYRHVFMVNFERNKAEMCNGAIVDYYIFNGMVVVVVLRVSTIRNPESILSLAHDMRFETVRRMHRYLIFPGHPWDVLINNAGQIVHVEIDAILIIKHSHGASLQ